ncbi:MAG: hypothetical protein JNM84_17640, partial [Planctomycetes bacterium]|nr:hypothetical protein [Planctomycetota bacterium]
HARFPAEQVFRPPQMLRDLVAKKRYGRKSGQGFYLWEGDKKQ